MGSGLYLSKLSSNGVELGLLVDSSGDVVSFKRL